MSVLCKLRIRPERPLRKVSRFGALPQIFEVEVSVSSSSSRMGESATGTIGFLV